MQYRRSELAHRLVVGLHQQTPPEPYRWTPASFSAGSRRLEGLVGEHALTTDEVGGDDACIRWVLQLLVAARVWQLALRLT
jgi:hypothetical protein